MIYEIMNSEEFRKSSTSFIVSLPMADEFMADLYDYEIENLFYEYTDEDIEETLNNNEFFIISRNYYGENEYPEYFVEPLLHKGEQFWLENDYIFIDEDLLDVVDKDKLCGEILTFRVEEEVDEDEEENCCEWCSGFEAGYRTAIEEMQELLGELVR